MFYLIKWLYMWLLPIGGIILGLAILAAYMIHQKAKGRYALIVLTVALYLLSIAPVADALIHPLERAYSQPTLAALRGDVIVLLGGGARAGVPDVDGTGQIGEAAANRFLVATRLQKAKGLPVLLSGGAALPGDAQEAVIEKRMLQSLGVPDSAIYMDTKSRNTAENARFAKALCAQHGWQHPIVVTSAFHLPRAVQFFQHEQLDVTPYPSDYRASADERLTIFSFVPQSYNLMNSCLAIKEYVGIAAAMTRLQ